MGNPVIANPLNRAVAGSVDFLSGAPTDFSGATRPVVLRLQRVIGRYDRWQIQRTMQVQQITHTLDAADDTMTVLWRHDSALAGLEHIGDMLERLKPDRVLQAYVDAGKRDRRLLFQGHPQVNTFQRDPRNLSLSVTCLSAGQERIRHGLNQQILGRMMRRQPAEEWVRLDPDAIEVPALPPIFNAGGRPNRSPTRLPFAGSDGSFVWLYMFIEDDAPGAEYWNYADALRYVAYHYCDRDYGTGRPPPIDVTKFLIDTSDQELYIGQGHASASLDPFIRDITRRCDDDVSIQSTNLDEALAILCERAGLHYRIDLLGTEVGRGGFDATYELNVSGHLTNSAATTNDLRKMLPVGRKDCPQDEPWADYTAATPREIAESGACDAAQITIDDRRVNRAIFFGGYREYEVTLLLRPGWEPHANLDNIAQDATSIERAINFWLLDFDHEYELAPTEGDRVPVSIYHAEHPDHGPVADIFRLWVFPDSDEYDADTLGRTVGAEAGVDPIWDANKYRPQGNRADSSGEGGITWYSDATYGAGLGADIVGAWAPRRRPFFDTIGRKNFKTTDQAPIVRFHWGNGTKTPPSFTDPGWVEYLGAIEIDPQRAAIRLVEANIFKAQHFLKNPEKYWEPNGTAIEQYINLDFWVSITCTIRSDERLRFDPTKANPVDRAQIFDLGFERFQYRRRRLGNSHLSALATDVVAYETRNDEEAFQGYCQRIFEDMQLPIVAGRASIFFLTDEFRPGDSLTGIHGLQIPFERHPIIERVVWTFAGGAQRTDLMVTDLRAAPEAMP